MKEIDFHTKRTTVENRLARQGFKPIGFGCYATVYGKPDVDYVVKIVNNGDKGYLRFLAESIHCDNPHFPKVHEIEEYATFTMVKMERLAHFYDGDEPDFIVGYELEDMVKGECRIRNRKSQPASFWHAVRLLRSWVDEEVSRPDIHCHNVMLRGKTLVITDPFV